MTVGQVSDANALKLPCLRQLDTTSLELRGEQVNDGTVAKFFGHKKLRELHIVDAKRVTNTGLTFIENLRSLEWLNLDGLAITDRGLFFIKNMKHLKGLHLTNAFLNGCGLKHLMALKELEYLCLCGTGIDDTGINTLTKLKNLRTLRLSETAVTDTGVKKLRRLKRLKTLFLHKTRVSLECIEQLVIAMPECEIFWSPYSPPKLLPAKLPLLQPEYKYAQSLFSFPRQDEGFAAAYSNGYLQFVAQFYRLQVERRRLSGTRSTFLITTDFRASQPDWIELLDWCSNQ